MSAPFSSTHHAQDQGRAGVDEGTYIVVFNRTRSGVTVGRDLLACLLACQLVQRGKAFDTPHCAQNKSSQVGACKVERENMEKKGPVMITVTKAKFAVRQPVCSVVLP